VTYVTEELLFIFSKNNTLMANHTELFVIIAFPLC